MANHRRRSHPPEVVGDTGLGGADANAGGQGSGPGLEGQMQPSMAVDADAMMQAPAAKRRRISDPTSSEGGDDDEASASASRPGAGTASVGANTGSGTGAEAGGRSSARAASGSSAADTRSESDDVVLEPLETPHVECRICIDTVPWNETVATCDKHSADHRCCYPCATGHIRAKLTAGTTGIFCPLCADAPPEGASSSSSGAQEGPTEFSHKSIVAVVGWGGTSLGAAKMASLGSTPLSDQEFRRYAAVVMIPAAFRGSRSTSSKAARTPVTELAGETPRGPETTVSCPSCNTIIVTSVGAQPMEDRCPHCWTAICRACGVGWLESQHAGKACTAAKDVLQAKADEAALEAGGGFKRCPSCGVGTTHYRKHGCHHISCPSCGAQWCHVCCGPHPCRHGCKLSCDETCDCLDCPDCKKKKPCGTCNQSGCLSCEGETSAAREHRLATQERKRAEKMQKGWVGPQPRRPAGYKPSDYPRGPHDYVDAPPVSSSRNFRPLPPVPAGGPSWSPSSASTATSMGVTGGAGALPIVYDTSRTGEKTYAYAPGGRPQRLAAMAAAARQNRARAGAGGGGAAGSAPGGMHYSSGDDDDDEDIEHSDRAGQRPHKRGN